MGRSRLMRLMQAGVLGGGAAKKYSISGRVLAADETTPVANATIAFGLLTATSGADGTFTIENVPAGTSGSLTATLTNYSFYTIAVAAMAADLTGQRFIAWPTASTIFVRTTGNDTTGNGSTGTPYKTFKKALSVAIAGKTIVAGDGTYAEAEGAGASGYLRINKNLADWLILQPEKGSAGAVTITGTTGAAINVYFTPGDTSAYIKFRYLTFGMCSASSTIVRNGSTISNIYFDYCTFAGTDAAAGFGWYDVRAVNASGITFNHCTWTCAAGATALVSVRIQISGGTTSTYLFDTCTIAGGLSNANYAINVSSTVAGAAIGFTNCTVSAGAAFTCNGGTVTITNGTYTGSMTGNCVLFGVDAATGGNTTTGVITGATIVHDVSKVGHSLIFGNGCGAGSGANNVTIAQAYDYALVVKECTGVEVQNCNLTGGTVSALLFKAAVSANAHNNTMTGGGSTGTFQLRNGDTGNKCQNWNFQNNIVNVTGTGKALNIGNDTHDLGGGVCDNNTYQSNSGLGVVRNDGNVANLIELQAAWADYSVTTNDANSTVV